MINNGYYQIGTNTQRSSSNMEGGIKVLYGIIGGVQTLIHIISSSLDVYYFGKEFKSLVIDSLIQLSGFCVKLIKYIASFQWITDALYNVQYFQNKYGFEEFKCYNTFTYFTRKHDICISDHSENQNYVMRPSLEISFRQIRKNR